MSGSAIDKLLLLLLLLFMTILGLIIIELHTQTLSASRIIDRHIRHLHQGKKIQAPLGFHVIVLCMRITVKEVSFGVYGFLTCTSTQISRPVRPTCFTNDTLSLPVPQVKSIQVSPYKGGGVSQSLEFKKKLMKVCRSASHSDV